MYCDCDVITDEHDKEDYIAFELCLALETITVSGGSHFSCARSCLEPAVLWSGLTQPSMRKSYLCWFHTVLSGSGWCQAVPGAGPSYWPPSAGTHFRRFSRRCRKLRSWTCTDRIPWRAACPPGACTPVRPRTAGRSYGRRDPLPPARTPGSSCSGPARSRWGS